MYYIHSPFDGHAYDFQDLYFTKKILLAALLKTCTWSHTQVLLGIYLDIWKC